MLQFSIRVNVQVDVYVLPPFGQILAVPSALTFRVQFLSHYFFSTTAFQFKRL